MARQSSVLHNGVCLLAGCDRKHHGRGLCLKHYRRKQLAVERAPRIREAFLRTTAVVDLEAYWPEHFAYRQGRRIDRRYALVELDTYLRRAAA